MREKQALEDLESLYRVLSENAVVRAKELAARVLKPAIATLTKVLVRLDDLRKENSELRQVLRERNLPIEAIVANSDEHLLLDVQTRLEQMAANKFGMAFHALMEARDVVKEMRGEPQTATSEMD